MTTDRTLKLTAKIRCIRPIREAISSVLMIRLNDLQKESRQQAFVARIFSANRQHPFIFHPNGTAVLLKHKQST